MPNVARAMAHRLVEQSTEASVESLFGHVKRVFRDDRQSLAPDHVELLSLAYIRARLHRSSTATLPVLPEVGVLPPTAFDELDDSDDDGSPLPAPAAGTAAAAAAALKAKPPPAPKAPAKGKGKVKVKLGHTPAVKAAAKKKTGPKVKKVGKVQARAAKGAAASAAALDAKSESVTD